MAKAIHTCKCLSRIDGATFCLFSFIVECLIGQAIGHNDCIGNIKIKSFGLIVDVLNNSGRIAGDHGICRNIFHNHTAGSNYCIIANNHTWANRGLAPDPHIVADFNRIRELIIVGIILAKLCIQRVGCRVNVNTRCNQTIIANRYQCRIQNNTIEIQVEVLAENKVVTVVDAERFLDVKFSPVVLWMQYFLKHKPLRGRIGFVDFIEFAN